MPDAKRRTALKTVRAAQKQFERESAAAQKARRNVFAQAQKEGLSLREKPVLSPTSGYVLL